MTDVVIGIVSILLTAAGLGWTFYAWRLRELRRDEVLAWGNECIEVLQRVFLECREIEQRQPPNREHLREFGRRASILVEQGRIFFRNAEPEKFGQDKLPAYRGYRPKILDPLVSTFQIADQLYSLDENSQSKCCQLALNNLRTFVSLLQEEVGRDRTASADTSVGGRGILLSIQLDQLEDRRTGF